MKFQLPSLKQIGQLLLTLLIAVIAGTGLLTLIYTIPIDRIDANVADSTYIFSREGNYPALDSSYVSILDNYTDAMMLKEAAYNGTDSAFQKAMFAPRNIVANYADKQPADEIVRYYSHPEDEHTVSTYARYWHGYLVFLKPLLTFLNYGQIRNINMYIQLVLGILILVLLIIKKNWHLIPAYILTALMLRTELSAYSLQHSNIYYVILISSILLLLFNKRLKEGNGILIFFLILGASTSYFDYLTYPLVAFGIPATLFVFMNRYEKFSDLRFVINLLVCWGIGYIGMWASKWILATIFTNENVIANAIDTIKIRSGSRYGEAVYTYKDTLCETFTNFIRAPYLITYIVVLLIEIIAFVFLHKKNPLKESISMIVISMLPLVWYACTINHSFIHKELFTYKEWAISSFALLALFANIEIKNKKH